MALLTALSNGARVLTPTRAVGLIALLAFLAAAGCMLAGRGDARAKFAFSHEKHVVEQHLECINCHADAGRLDKPGLPSPDACSVCHDEVDAQKPPEKSIATLFDGETYRASHAASLAGEIVFSHKRHAAAIQCSACHRGIESNERIVPSMHLAMSDCTSCHAERHVAQPAVSAGAAAGGASSQCAVCHREVRADVAPPTHEHNWKRMHGQCVRSRSDATVDRCSLCHSDSTCVQCHREEAPENHNAFWHLRGHGLAAMADRQNCAACHEADSCARCHAESPPRNHVGMWGAPHDTHCLSCHFPLRQQGCVACHAGTPSHLSAAPKPNDPVHVRGLNCRQCHAPGLTAPLPHVDNGDDCNACHH
jgi:hypothetical protein